MTRRWPSLVALACAGLLTAGSAAAQTAAGPAPAEPIPPVPPAAASPAVAAQPVTPATPPTPPTPPVPPEPSVQLVVPWRGPTGRGVSIGMEEGAWSGVWGTGLRTFIPFVDQIGGPDAGSFGMTLRGLVLTGANVPSGEPADHYGGRLELTGRSPVYLNLVRLYGGGGVEVFSPFGPDATQQAKVGGGGHFGFEFFLNRRFSFYLEVGGHSGVDTSLPGGETVIAGMNVYPFSS